MKHSVEPLQGDIMAIRTIILFIIACSVLLVGCTTQTPEQEKAQAAPPEPAEQEIAPEIPPEPTLPPEDTVEAELQETETENEELAEETEQVAEVVDSTKPLWQTAELTDVKSGSSFTIGGHDKPVVLESFAVWCPTCTRQQKNIKALHAEVSDDVISIALNTDPNEDKDLVLNHINSNGFDWNYAISPVDVTKDLIAEFGNNIVNAPQAPVVVLCPDGTSTLLGRGVKSVDDLKAAVAECGA